MIRNLWSAWRTMAHYIADFQSRLVLTVFYFTVALPFGLASRFLSDPLGVREYDHKRPKPASEVSGWCARQTTDLNLEDVKRQF